MRYLALATDYDGTIAHDGRVDGPTVDALRRLRASGRRLVMVTGRELDGDGIARPRHSRMIMKPPAHVHSESWSFERATSTSDCGAEAAGVVRQNRRIIRSERCILQVGFSTLADASAVQHDPDVSNAPGLASGRAWPMGAACDRPP